MKEMEIRGEKMENFAQRLRAARLRKGLSQQQMADRLNIHRTSYTKYETTNVEPPLSTFREIVRILDVDPMDLLE